VLGGAIVIDAERIYQDFMEYDHPESLLQKAYEKCEEVYGSIYNGSPIDVLLWEVIKHTLEQYKLTSPRLKRAGILRRCYATA
jgi:hypothetical protein